MTNPLLTVSLAPHAYGKFSVKQMMCEVVVALVPALVAAVYVFGIDALRVTLIASVSAIVFEYSIQRWMLKIPPTISDGSALITGMLLAFNLPSTIPSWIIIIGSFVAIAIGKMSFGGLGNNPFNPALVGRVFLLVSFPAQMTSWPKPSIAQFLATDAVTAATPLAIVKDGLKDGASVSQLMTHIPGYWDMFVGNMGGCIGEVSALALLVGFLYLLYRKIITWHIPVSMLGTVALFSGILWMNNPQKYADPLFHILTGGVMLGAIFMATDLVTSPIAPHGMIIFGMGIGIITVVIRVFGAYPEGVSFAILIMNSLVPIIDRHCKPRRFGE